MLQQMRDACFPPVRFVLDLLSPALRALSCGARLPSRLSCIFPDLFSCLEGVYALGLHSRLDGSQFRASIGNL
jgi:hypothetical protein